jgi:UDP-glucose 4-epimerase
MPIKKFTANHPVLRYHYILETWKLAKLQPWAARHPVFSRWIKIDLDVAPEHNDAVIIPVQEVIQGGSNTVLPYQILEPIAEKATGHMLLGKCLCGNAKNCDTYPHAFGHLFLGEDVTQVSSKIGTQTNVEGAMQHVAQALELGLVLMIVYANFDAALIRLPYEKTLAICFCCDCCCTVRHHMRQGPSTFDNTMQRLPGLTVTINQNFIACGDCHNARPVNAIQFLDDISVIDQDRCRGCGVCAPICPEHAPQLHMDESIDVVSKLVGCIRTRTEIGV